MSVTVFPSDCPWCHLHPPMVMGREPTILPLFCWHSLGLVGHHCCPVCVSTPGLGGFGGGTSLLGSLDDPVVNWGEWGW